MILEFVIFLVIAGICGSIAQSLAGFSRGGCLTSIGLGLIGAVLGTYLARALGMEDFLAIPIAGKNFPVVWSIIGAALFVAALGLITRRSPAA